MVTRFTRLPPWSSLLFIVCLREGHYHSELSYESSAKRLLNPMVDTIVVYYDFFYKDTINGGGRV
jgi:hypothetical protein